MLQELQQQLQAGLRLRLLHGLLLLPQALQQRVDVTQAEVGCLTAYGPFQLLRQRLGSPCLCRCSPRNQLHTSMSVQGARCCPCDWLGQ